MSNPSGTTHDHSIPGDKLETQMAILDGLKDLLEDTGKKNKRAFIACHKSVDGRHHFERVMKKTIRANKVGGGTVMVSSYDFKGFTHFYEQCSCCQKLTMSCAALEHQIKGDE